MPHLCEIYAAALLGGRGAPGASASCAEVGCWLPSRDGCRYEDPDGSDTSSERMAASSVSGSGSASAEGGVKASTALYSAVAGIAGGGGMTATGAGGAGGSDSGWVMSAAGAAL